MWCEKRAHCVVSLVVHCFASLPALSFPRISPCPGIHGINVSASFWLCGLLCWLLLVGHDYRLFVVLHLGDCLGCLL